MSGGVRHGLQLPQSGRLANRGEVLGLAVEAEDAGLDSVWVSDHLVHPVDHAGTYPYSRTGDVPFDPEDGYLEALVTLATIAGGTERVRLGTSVLVLPMRDTLATVKQLTSLDVLCEGRLDLAVGAGWWEEEYRALGKPFATRGTRLDEQLVVLETLWRDGRGSFDGREVSFPPVTVRPLPVQAGRPSLWIAGAGRRVFERVARHEGAGWHGIGADPGRIEGAKAAIAEACRAAGRDDPVPLSVAVTVPRTRGELEDRVERLRGLGISQIVWIPHGRDETSGRDALGWIAGVGHDGDGASAAEASRDQCGGGTA